MDNIYFFNKYRIPSARADWHDYDSGLYFVTICTKNRDHHFGEIDNKGMHLSAIGIYAQDCIQQTPNHHPYADIPLFVVMPDHIHAIVSIDSGKTPHNKRSIESLYDINNGVMTRDGDDVGDIELKQYGTSTQFATQMQTWLSVVIRMFKASVTGFAKANSIPFCWQTRFHDHIIRNNEELNGIAQYIENNVAKWILDKCR